MKMEKSQKDEKKWIPKKSCKKNICPAKEPEKNFK